MFVWFEFQVREQKVLQWTHLPYRILWDGEHQSLGTLPSATLVSIFLFPLSLGEQSLGTKRLSSSKFRGFSQPLCPETPLRLLVLSSPLHGGFQTMAWQLILSKQVGVGRGGETFSSKCWELLIPSVIHGKALQASSL